MDDATREYFELLLAERRAQARAHDGDTPEWLSEIIDELEEDLHERRPIENAIRGVWASLWTERAFDDRVWRGIDHRDAYMAIAVHPAFVREEVNAVAVTGSSAVGAEPYALLSQVGYESVVEPMDPTATAERIEFVRAAGSRLPANVLVHSHSSLSEGGARLWSDAQLEVLADLLFTVHDHFEALVRQHDPSATPRFDVEIERTVDGEIVIKQVRRYLGGG